MKTLYRSLFAMLPFLSADLYAAEASCTAKLLEVGAHQPDKLVIRLNGVNFLTVCSFTSAGQFNRVTPELCKSFASIAGQALAMGANLFLIIDNAPSTDCSSIQSFSGVDVRYMSVIP